MGIGAGINFTVSGVTQALGNLATTVIGTVENTLASLVGPYRPGGWANPAQTTVIVPGNPAGAYSSASLGANAGGTQLLTDDSGNPLPIFANTGVALVPGATSSPDTVYVFDAVLELEHEQGLVPTQHPVQNGAAISDHAFIKPSRISLDILMSDAMQSYTIGQWTGGASKSVNAWQTMIALMQSRQVVTVNTRLQTYSNMLLVDCQTRDNVKTGHGLRARLTFQQIFSATVTTQQVNSARPQDTQQTAGAVGSTATVPAAVSGPYSYLPPATSGQVTGAGNWSSNPVADDPGLGS